MRFCSIVVLLLLPALAWADGNRLTYLDEANPYYVSRTFPKLITPQWVGEKGVDAVVILAIDDMRDHKRYEAFLRPILNRLKKIDGRAAVSIMTNRINPKEPHLQQWLKEGVSIETHTFDHPCPFFKSGKFGVAKETYDKCVDLMAAIPGSRAVAFRMPCCDSLNTPSPRFWTEIFNRTTGKGNYLTIDTSVFQVFTAADPELPRQLVLMKDGSERFRKYLPRDRTFVNTIENYPYPYVIGGLCWEFPCMTPSDWEAQHLHKPNNPETVADWKAAIDATVIKKGTFSMVFHPHGWIKNDQIVELIDYAQKKYGKRVKFLNFREALERMEKNLLAGQSLRNPADGGDNGIRILDVNNDGYLDVVIGNGQLRQTRIWSPKTQTWKTTGFPVDLTRFSVFSKIKPGNVFHFGILQKNGNASFLYRTPFARGGWHFVGNTWNKDRALFDVVEINGKNVYTAMQSGADNGVRLRDLDGGGRCEMIVSNPKHQGIFTWSDKDKNWKVLPFTLPTGAVLVDAKGRDNGVRFVDVNEDGHDDVVFSNEKDYGIYLFKDMKTGWSRKVMAGKRADKDALPMIASRGTNYGFWVHSRGLWWSNESTPLLKDHVARRSFNELLKNVEPQAKSPQASLKCMQARPGFTVELVAAEPLVQDPIAFAWGPDGKLWVVEMGDYPLGTDGKGKHGGRVKYLQDTNGDGKYDKATLFLDKIGYPTGVLPWKKGVLVTCAPDIFYAEDTNGDGKADVKEVLYTGFREGNQQHRVNGLVWGLDNWIYVANGDSGGAIKSLKTGKTLSFSGRDLRIRPWNGDMEAQLGQTQFGRSRDDWGNWFGNNNSNPMYHYALDDHYLRRNPNYAPPPSRVQISVKPGAAQVYPISRPLPRFNNPQSVNHFTSACSAIVYRDNLFGPAFANNTFVSEPVHNLIHREIMSPKGFTFTSRRADDEQQSEFLASSDNWFRPTMIQTGPDGALWVADMYRYVIEHPQWIPLDWQKKLDLRAGHDKGRIYRIYPLGKKLRSIPHLDRYDTIGLVGALDSPNGWQRDMAQMMIVMNKNRKAIPLLTKTAMENKNPLARLHALCTLDGLDALTPRLVEKALSDSHPGVRRHAVRLSENLLRKNPQIGTHLVKLLSDAHAQVRMQLAYTLGEWNDPRAGKALAKVALQDGKDRYLLAAVMSSVNKKHIEPMLLALLAEKKNRANVAPLVESLIQLAQRQGNRRVMTTLLASLAMPQQGSYEAWQFSALAGLLDTLEQRNDSLAKMRARGDAKLKASLQEITGLFAAARTLAADSQMPLEKRREAVRLLGRGLDHEKEDVSLLAKLLSPQSPRELQLATATALGKLDSDRVLVLLLKGWKSYAPALRVEVLDALLSRRGGETAVLTALEKKKILPFEIDASRRQRLLQNKSAKIRKRASRLLASSVNSDRRKVIADFQKALVLKGDATRGKMVFEKNCAACHHLGGIGQKVGPDLTALAGKSPEQLLVAILDPNQAVEARYVNYTALTKNGRTYSGLLAEETSTSLTLAGSDGKKQVILRADLDELFSSGKSVMPEGLEKDITATQMADLLAFVRGNLPRMPRKTFAGNRPEIVKAGKDGALLLTSKNCEIYGPSIILETKYGNLGWWSNTKDHVIWTVDVPRAAKYAVWFDYACHDNSSGNSFVIEAGKASLRGKVQGTGDWDHYKHARIGSMALPAGRMQILMRSDGPIRGALLDLKSIKIILQKRK